MNPFSVLIRALPALGTEHLPRERNVHDARVWRPVFHQADGGHVRIHVVNKVGGSVDRVDYEQPALLVPGLKGIHPVFFPQKLCVRDDFFQARGQKILHLLIIDRDKVRAALLVLDMQIRAVGAVSGLAV